MFYLQISGETCLPRPTNDTLKPWLDGRLFAAVLGDCGQRQGRRSGTIGVDLHRDASTILTNEKGTRPPCNIGRFVQYFEQIADDRRWLHVFMGKAIIQPLFYATNDVSLTYCCLWGSLAVADVLLHCLESPIVAGKSRPSNQAFKC